MSVVLDASALLAVILEEPGADIVIAAARGAICSTVNLDEVLHKTRRRDLPANEVEALLLRLEIGFAPFGVEQARRCAELHKQVAGLNVSFADRACLSLGLLTQRPILTADRDWRTFDLADLLGLDIRLIR